MDEKTIRQQIETYVKKKYHIETEQLPFNREDYAILRHRDSGKWFAVFIVKPYAEFGMQGIGNVEVISLKPRDPVIAESLMDQPGYLRGYPSRKWNWISIVLDGTVSYEEIRKLLDESYQATRKGQNMNTRL